MRVARLRLTGAMVLAACLASAPRAHADPYEQRSAASRALYSSMAVVANVVPIVSAFYAPQCLPGYIVCKVVFAGISVIAATDLLWMTGPEDTTQPFAVLQRGFGGDWYLTGRHIAGDARPQPYPEAPPPKSESAGGWEPPPL